MELVVTDLQRSHNFYVDVLDLVVTAEDENAVYLRSFEEFIHQNLGSESHLPCLRRPIQPARFKARRVAALTAGAGTAHGDVIYMWTPRQPTSSEAVSSPIRCQRWCRAR
ncbi:hypothetical protein ASG84_25890 [Rhodococcus sp. Leaf278]|nr:hypothetical protein ASG84_25890 [Rhodococcus sp. Leaf278]